MFVGKLLNVITDFYAFFCVVCQSRAVRNNVSSNLEYSKKDFKFIKIVCINVVVFALFRICEIEFTTQKVVEEMYDD